MTLKISQNGVVRDCTPQEEAAFLAEWAANDLLPKRTVLTMRHLQRALHNANRLAPLKAALAASSDENLKIDWATATVVARSDEMVEKARVLLGLTNNQVDNVFNQTVAAPPITGK